MARRQVVLACPRQALPPVRVPHVRLQAALQQAGHAIQLLTEVGAVDDSPSRRLAAAAAERQRQAEAFILQDPLVQAMQRDFGGKIVPGSIQPL